MDMDHSEVHVDRVVHVDETACITMSAAQRALRCIVTGGSSGIGEAICHELGKRGHQVFVTGRNAQNLQRVAAAVREVGGRSAIGTGDVCCEQDVQRLFKEACTFFQQPDGASGSKPACDLLITSAGIGRFGLIENMEEADFQHVFDVNVKGVWLWAREVLPCMKAQSNGQVVFVSSVAGLRKFARCSVYGASKWAVQGIAGSLREECRGTGVKVATVCPGSVATPWWLERERGGKEAPPSEEQLLQMLLPVDVAKAILAVVEQVHNV